jgi:hypothetical protein
VKEILILCSSLAAVVVEQITLVVVVPVVWSMVKGF